jgi:hypothetical protein
MWIESSECEEDCTLARFVFADKTRHLFDRERLGILGRAEIRDMCRDKLHQKPPDANFPLNSQIVRKWLW